VSHALDEGRGRRLDDERFGFGARRRRPAELAQHQNPRGATLLGEGAARKSLRVPLE